MNQPIPTKSALVKNKPPSPAMVRIREQKNVQLANFNKILTQYYMDILAQAYEPEGGCHLVIGTTFGQISIFRVHLKPQPIRRAKITMDPLADKKALDRISNSMDCTESDTKDLTVIQSFVIPNKEPILSIKWGNRGIYVGSKNTFFLYNWNSDLKQLDEKPVVKMITPFDILDACFTNERKTDNFVLACADSKARVYNLESEKQIMELKDHFGIVEACKSSTDFVVTGAQDGYVHLYDCEFRSKSPTASFAVKKAISNLALADSSTWLAVLTQGCDSPVVYNVRTKSALQNFEMKKAARAYAVHFDARSCLYWGGEDGVVFKSKNLTKVSSEIPTTCGDDKISLIYSIGSALTYYSGIRLSTAGAGNGILISENSDYWNNYLRV